MNEVQCELMKANRMQCTNKAFVSINGIATCRLDLNWFMNRIIDGSLQLDHAEIKPLFTEDTDEVNKIIAFTTKTVAEAKAAKEAQPQS